MKQQEMDPRRGAGGSTVRAAHMRQRDRSERNNTLTEPRLSRSYDCTSTPSSTLTGSVRQQRRDGEDSRATQPASGEHGGNMNGQTSMPVHSWDSATWKSYKLSDLPSPVVGQLSANGMSGSPALSALSAASASTTLDSARAIAPTSSSNTEGGLLERKKSVEQELTEWEQWSNMSQSINEVKHGGQQSQASAAAVHVSTTTTTSSQEHQGGATPAAAASASRRDWRSGLSDAHLTRYRDLEAQRDCATTVEAMSAAMKELQQLERAFLAGDIQPATSSYVPDSLDRLIIAA